MTEVLPFLPPWRAMSPRVTSISRRPDYEEEQSFWLWRLETWLFLSLIALVFQLWPALFWGLLYALDVRNWTWGVWIGVEVAVVAVLLVLHAWQKSD